MRRLTVNDLAAEFQISRRQVYRLLDRGLPAVRIGDKSLRFDPQAIAAWLEAQREQR